MYQHFDICNLCFHISLVSTGIVFIYLLTASILCGFVFQISFRTRGNTRLLNGEKCVKNLSTALILQCLVDRAVMLCYSDHQVIYIRHHHCIFIFASPSMIYVKGNNEGHRIFTVQLRVLRRKETVINQDIYHLLINNIVTWSYDVVPI